MRKAIVLCLTAVLVSGAAYGVDYTFAGAAGATWDASSTWSPQIVLPGTTGDSYRMTGPRPTTDCVTLPNPGAGNTRRFGSVTIDNGTLRIPTGALGAYRFVADNGQTGSLTMTGPNARLAKIGSGWNVTFDMDGNFIYNPTPTTSTNAFTGTTIRMRGSGVTYRVQTYTETYNHTKKVIVDNGATVNFVAPGTGRNAFVDIEIWGTATGPVYTSILNRSKLLRGPSANTRDLDAYMAWYEGDWGAGNANPRSGAGMFLTAGRYRDVDLGNAWNNVTAAAQYNARCIGDLRARNLYLQYNAGGGSRATYWLNTDNETSGGVLSNITTDCDLFIGRSSVGVNWVVGLIAGRSTIDVGRDLRIMNTRAYNGTGNYMTFTTGTLRIGRNLTIDNGIGTGALWNMGTSTAIFDGNFGSECGTYAAQTIASKGLPFYNVEINNPGGTVTLADNLLLKGNFDLTAGTLAVGSGASAKYIIFQGGIDCETLAQQIDIDTAAALKKIHIKAGSSTFVKLMSDLTVTDNLDIDAGSKLFLNGFMLTAEGTQYSGSGTWTVREGGEIVGAAAPIPEPATWLLLGTGALGLVGYARRRRMK